MDNRSKDLLAKVKIDEKDLKTMILEYDPLGIGYPPEDEYDYLVRRILSILYNHPTELLSLTVLSEIDKNSDKSLKTEIEVQEITDTILLWWNGKGSSNGSNDN